MPQSCMAIGYMGARKKPTNDSATALPIKEGTNHTTNCNLDDSGKQTGKRTGGIYEHENQELIKVESGLCVRGKTNAYPMQSPQ